MLFNSQFSLVLSSSAEILSPGLTLHIHLIILASFLDILITFFILTSKVSLPYSVTLGTHAEKNLPFARKGKPPLAGHYISELTPSYLYPCYTFVKRTPFSSYSVAKISILHIFQTLNI